MKIDRSLSRGAQATDQEVSVHFTISDCVFRALSDLSAAFPIQVDGRPDQNQANMARRVLEVALANIEIIAPRILSLIRYSDAEGLEQADYLESLIEAKFKKKLRRPATKHDSR